MALSPMDFLDRAEEITSEFTFASDMTWNTNMSHIYKCGNLIMGFLRFTTPTGTATNNRAVITIPAKYKNVEANSSYTMYLGPVVQAFGGETRGTLIITPTPNVIALAGSAWATNTQVVARFIYWTE